MRIKSAQKQKQSTVLEVDTGDPKDQRFHIIPNGVLETRMEAWDLSEGEAMDLLLAESELEDEVPDRFEVSDLEAAREQIKSLIDGHEVTWGVAKADVISMAAMPPEISKVIRDHVRSEISRSSAAPAGDAVGSLASSFSKGEEVKKGYERLAEERLADDIIAASPDLKKVPRVKPEEPVGLTVKYI